MPIPKTLLNNINSKLYDIEYQLKEILILNKRVQNIKRFLHSIERLYLNGYLSNDELISWGKYLENKKKELEGLLLERLYKISVDINDVKSTIKFLEDSNKNFGNNITEIRNINNIKQKIENINNNIKKIEEDNNIHIDVNKLSIIQKFLKSNEKENKEKKNIEIKNIKISNLEKKNINMLKLYAKFANKILGKISNYIIESSPSLKYYIRSILDNSYINVSMDEFLSMIIFPILITAISGIIYFAIQFNPIALLYTLLIISGLSGLIFYIMNYEKDRYRSSIDKNLVFAIIHLSSLLQSGLTLENAIKIIADTEEYEALSKEFSKLYNLLKLGIGLSDALDIISKSTISQSLKDFLNELSLTVKSGRRIDEFLIIYSQQLLIYYRNYIDRLNKSLKSFSDLYVGMVLTVPMIFISMAIMLSTITASLFGLSLQDFLEIVTFVLIPIVNIGTLFILSKFEE